MAVLEFLTLTDSGNQDGQKLAAVVAKKLTAGQKKDVSTEKKTEAEPALISPGRQKVSFTFAGQHRDAESSAPSVHPAVQQALLTPLLQRLHQALPESGAERSLLELLAPPLHRTSEQGGLQVDTSQGPEELYADGPLTPASGLAYNQFSPLPEPPTKSCSETPEGAGRDEHQEPPPDGGEWKYCNVCRDAGDMRCSRCKGVHYCSARCQTCDWAFHKRVCRSKKTGEADTHTDPTVPSPSPSAPTTASSKRGLFASLQSLSPSKRGGGAAMAKFGGRKMTRGLSGLANLGNTCYLNSSLQCLSHVFPLVKYFITNEYEKHVNTTSVDSTKGVFAKEFASLLKNLWLRPYPASLFQPTSFRRVLGLMNRDYATFQQQDAHDLLAFVLDRLHEDVNIIEKKPYTEASEVETLADEERVGRENWDKHLLRHNSAVQDVVGGFLKSQIVCPLLDKCGKVSIKFDYTSTVQLAIPQPKREGRERRERSNSMGSNSGRSRNRTTSGNSQYMDLLVNNGRGRLSSLNAIELPICFVPQVPASPTAPSGLPHHKGVLALSALSHLDNHSPIEVMMEEVKRSKLFAVKQKLINSLLRCVKSIYDGVDSSPFKQREEGELILVELEEAPVTGGGGGRGSALSLHRGRGSEAPGFVASRVLHDKDTVGSVVSSGVAAGATGEVEDEEDEDEPAVIAAYWLSAAQAASTPNFTFLMQKKVDARGRAGEAEQEAGSRLVGKPLLLAYDASWSCARFRYAIWKQVQRFVSHAAGSSPGMLSSDEEEERGQEDHERESMETLLKGDLKTQMLLSRHLRIRLVDRLGNPQAGNHDTAPAANDKASDDSSPDETVVLLQDLQLNCAAPPPTPEVDDQSADHLSLLPTSQHISVQDFIGEGVEAFSFFCVEYVHGWMNFVDDVAMSLVQPLSPEGQLLPPVSTLSDSDDEEGVYSKLDPFAGIECDEMDLSNLSVKETVSPSKPVLNRVVPEGTLTLEDCLQLYTSEEVLDEANSWYCNKCGTHRQAFKTLQFYMLPPVLIFGLKRFETRTVGASMYGGGGVLREKIGSFVDFPLNGLDMSPYCKPLPPASPGATTGAGLEEVDERYLYDLVAVCNHYGRMGFGHYTAFAREWDGTSAPLRNDSWCCYDDEVIHPIDAKSVKTSAAYILFYRRRRF